jgi:excisionase family DNA binding protein
MDRTDPPVMTLIEVADYLRIPKASVYKLAQQGRIPCQKVGKHWRFRKEALDRWLEADRSEEASARRSDFGEAKIRDRSRNQ